MKTLAAALAAPLVGLLVLGGCGSSGGVTPAGPAEPPPADPSGPPPAWVETAAGARWLGHGSFCWEGICADYFDEPTCGDEPAPRVAVEPDEVVRFHLDFDPSDVRLTFFDDGQEIGLRAQPEPEWRVHRVGGAWLTVRVGDDDVSYGACFEAS